MRRDVHKVRPKKPSIEIICVLVTSTFWRTPKTQLATNCTRVQSREPRDTHPHDGQLGGPTADRANDTRAANGCLHTTARRHRACICGLLHVLRSSVGNTIILSSSSSRASFSRRKYFRAEPKDLACKKGKHTTNR